jgi:hypothetical protein
VVNGKGGDLIHFLNGTEIPKDRWSSLLGVNGLCSAVVKGKGGDLRRFLNDAEIPEDNWPSFLGGAACAAPFHEAKDTDS